ncbi:MAG: hypothetical protein AAF430_26420 [Myxococcota bacterium]
MAAMVDEEVLADVSIEELREFLEADLFESSADPKFKERLRERLWALVQDRYGPDSDRH